MGKLFAPGVFIGDPSMTGTMLGTSQAAPHVAGAAAVLRSMPQNSTISPAETAAIFWLSGQTINDTLSSGEKRRLDVSAAVQSVIGPVSISISGPSGPYSIGSVVQLQAQAYTARSTSAPLPTDLTWTSSVPSVATVDAAGRVTTLALGTTSVTASGTSVLNTKIQTIFQVAIRAAPVLTTIAISYPNLGITTLNVGTTMQVMRVLAFDQNGSSFTPTPQYKWTSLNTAIATVNDAAPNNSIPLMTGIDGGSVVMQVSTIDGKLSASQALTVIKPSPTDTGPWTNGASLQFCQGQFPTVRATYSFTISGAAESATISNLGSSSTYMVTPSGWTNGATLAVGAYSFQIVAPSPGSWPISMTFGGSGHVLPATIVGVTQTTCP